MKVNLKTITPNIEEIIVEIARVSSSRKNKTEKPEGLLNYLIKNHHWSPFEHGYITMEIETSKAIGIQLIRHRSFTFQEFSQRYQDVNKLTNGEMFEEIELRKQADNNRQSSEEVFEPKISRMVEAGGHGMPDYLPLDIGANKLIREHLRETQKLYNDLLKAGVAREQARMILPLTTKTRIYMTGSVRSWIHFIKLRDDEHAQKEVQLIAKDIKNILKKELPIISKSLN